jgi:hypothetical protein
MLLQSTKPNQYTLIPKKNYDNSSVSPKHLCLHPFSSIIYGYKNVFITCKLSYRFDWF